MARDCPHSLPLYLGFLAMVVIAPAQQVVRDQHSPGIIDRGIVIPAASFSREQAIRIARDFLQKEAKGASIARLLIAPDERSLNENYAHGTPHNTYQSTLADIERLGMPKGPMARLLAIRGQGKFSYLENGELTEEILSSFSDPTIFRDEEHSYELLHFTLTRTRFRGDPYFLTVYLKASPDVSISSCVRIYKKLREVTKIEDLSIVVRPDPWFMEEQRYPAVPAFTRPLDVPNSIRYISAAAVSCSLIGENIRCSGRNFVP